jgi:AAA+ ATPase superfamily predicted ATPase
VNDAVFVDRKTECDELTNVLEAKGFAFAVLYGRRRIGKTRLVLETIKQRTHVYYLAVEKENLRYFAAAVIQKFPKAKNLKEDWESLLDFLKDNAEVLVIDEFQNLVKEDKTTLSLFQRAIDTNLKNSSLKLIALGSSVSMITSELLQYQSPLYGRRTYTKRITAMSFLNIRGFFPKVSMQELAEIYGFADGIPYYLEKINEPFWVWLENGLRHSSFVKDELDFMLKYEFEDLGTYKTILEAIAMGKTVVSEIKNHARMQRTDLSPYLAKLINTGFIRRELPLTEPVTSKLGRYYIEDQFVAFWFRFIYPNLSNLEEGIYSASIVKKDYPQYMGFVFEKICRQVLIELIKQKRLGYDKVGKWWHKDTEIDAIALNAEKKEILFAECKWQDNVSANQILAQLNEKTSQVRWNNEQRKEKYVIFAKSFKEKNLNKENVLLFDLRDIENLMGSYCIGKRKF